MALSLKRTSLVAQVADAVRSEILGGEWPEWIPSERDLSQTLHVSRNTCRAALQALYREKLIEAVQGRGIRVNRAAITPQRLGGQHMRSVGVLIPEALGRLRPRNSLLIEEIQAELYDMGVRVHLHNSPACYQASPRHALERLVEKNHHDCWILVLSHQPLQNWFVQRGLPCVVSGSIYPDIRLPSVDYDYRAVCRHAAGKLIALGHRRLVFFNRRLRAAGDLESEIGFKEGARASSRADVDARVVYHDDTLESVAGVTKKIFAGSQHPTAAVVANSFCYLSVMSVLGRQGFRVPEDVSLISRDEDPFLAYVDPEPARYFYDGAGLARKLMVIIRSLLEGGAAKSDAARLVPRFAPGCSLRKLS